ncbi:MAG TPA: DUF2231 domain-containing protein [Terriglobales bacterium]|nr:DUF2231 domain-containing protein [Terriglobales bacterium]
MNYLPPIPTWDGLHPLIIHFPIVLLLVAPIFVILGVTMPKSGRAMYLAALVLMTFGTVSALVSYQTGEAAGKLAERTPEINAAIERHEELAETTRLLFSILTVIFAGLLYVPKLLRFEIGRKAQALAALVFLFFYSSGALVLVNTAHQGGMLVHQYGVHALVTPDSTGPPPATAAGGSGEQGD